MKRGVCRRLLGLDWGMGALLQAAAVAIAASAFAQPANLSNHHQNGEIPSCLDQSGSNLPVNNSQVLDWKASTPNNYLNRAHVTGSVVAVYPDQTGHAHFGIELDGQNAPQSANDLLEVVYDLGFGSIPEIQTGDRIEACGDYITAYAQSGHYPPSPDGALIHWIHKSDNPAKHADGFLVINGNLYGQELPND